MDASFDYLNKYLSRLDAYLQRPDVIELSINADGRIWTEVAGQTHMTPVDDAPLTQNEIKDLAHQFANRQQITLNETTPLLSASVDYQDMSLRAQAVIPPASLNGHILSFRVFRPRAGGEPRKFKFLRDIGISLEDERTKTIKNAMREAEGGNEDAFLQMVIDNKLNAVISGGTSTGKTELGRRLLWMVPDCERILTIEDSAELLPRQLNVVGLMAEKIENSNRSAGKLLQAALRLRPDRIILGEVRGQEAATFVEAINTGHSGSFTTLHADSARKALDRLALMILSTGTRLEYTDVIRYLKGSIDVIIQTGRSGSDRGIQEVWFPKEDASA